MSVKFKIDQRVRAKAGKLKGRGGVVELIRVSDDTGIVTYAVQLDTYVGGDFGPCAFIEEELEIR